MKPAVALWTLLPYRRTCPLPEEKVSLSSFVGLLLYNLPQRLLVEGLTTRAYVEG